MNTSDQTRVLVIDDEFHYVRFLSQLLSFDGYMVERAGDIPQAVAAIARRVPDLIVLDAWLPSGSGVGLCRTLRDSDATAHTPIIMLTGMDTPEMRRSAMAPGVTEFVTKPYRSTELRALIRSLLALERPAQAVA